MRILLDEDIPRRLGPLLIGLEASTVPGNGESGIKNGKLLILAATRFDVFLTMDQSLGFQQNLASLSIAVLLARALSKRLEHLRSLLPEILRALNRIQPKSLRRVGP